MTALSVIAVCFIACQSTSDPATGDLELDLRHRDPKVRIRASFQAVKDDRWDLVELLIGNLDDRDPAVRLFANTALRKLTGWEFDYKPHGTPAERQGAVRRLREQLSAGGFDATTGYAAPREASVPAKPAAKEGP